MEEEVVGSTGGVGWLPGVLAKRVYDAVRVVTLAMSAATDEVRAALFLISWMSVVRLVEATAAKLSR